MADGGHIRVTLNGAVIADFDLSLVQETEVLKNTLACGTRPDTSASWP